MSSRILFVMSLLVALAVPGLALAQGPILPQHSDPTWQASYWNNLSLSGTPALERTETALDYDWGSGSPDPSVNSDGFSARWTRYLDLEAKAYRFSATSDDGIRVFLDGDPIIDQWNDHGATTFTVDRTLTAGHHLIVVEFYENAGVAVARLTWEPVTPVTEWRGEYFNGVHFGTDIGLVRNDHEINFDWGSASPAPGIINADQFSVRWTRSLRLEAGNYRFAMTVDDGGRLWVNGHLLIDAWRDQAATTYTGDIYLPGGDIPVRMEYYENYGAAVAKLSWSRGGGQPGTVIVDNGDVGFVKGGSKSGWHTAPEGYDGDLLWTKNNDRVRPNYNWARWYPKLKAGRYEVFVYIPFRYTTTGRARYWISHANGFTLRILDQSANGDRWVSLGTYWFRGTDEDYVSLADVTYEPYLSRLIAWDAAKWVSR